MKIPILKRYSFFSPVIALSLCISVSNCKRGRVTDEDVREWEEAGGVMEGAGAPSPPPGEGPSTPVERDSVPLTGVVKFESYEGGPIQVDAFDRPQKEGGQKEMPRIVSFSRLDRPGDFTLQVPASKEYVWLSAYNDVDDDGKPSPGDPIGYYRMNPVKIGKEGVSGIEVVIPEQAGRP